jgi:hypothetical protein
VTSRPLGASIEFVKLPLFVVKTFLNFLIGHKNPPLTGNQRIYINYPLIYIGDQRMSRH